MDWNNDPLAKGKKEEDEKKPRKRRIRSGERNLQLSRSRDDTSTVVQVVHSVGFEYEIDEWKIWCDGDTTPGSKDLLIPFETVKDAELLKLEPDGDHAEIISNALTSVIEINAAVDGIPFVHTHIEKETRFKDSVFGTWWIKGSKTKIPLGSVHITVGVPLEFVVGLFECQNPVIERHKPSLETCRGATAALAKFPGVRGLCYLITYYQKSLRDLSITESDGPKAQLSLMSRFDFHTMYRVLSSDEKLAVDGWLGLKLGWDKAQPGSIQDVVGLFERLPEHPLSPLCHAGYNAVNFMIPPILCPSRLLWLYSIVAPERAFSIYLDQVDTLFQSASKGDVRFGIGWTFEVGGRWYYLEEETRCQVLDSSVKVLAEIDDRVRKRLEIDISRLRDVITRLDHEAPRDFLQRQHVPGKDLCSPLPWFIHNDKLPYAMGCYPKQNREYRCDQSERGVFLFEIRSIGPKGNGSRGKVNTEALRNQLRSLFEFLNDDTAEKRRRPILAEDAGLDREDGGPVEQLAQGLRCGACEEDVDVIAVYQPVACPRCNQAIGLCEDCENENPDFHAWCR